MNYPSGVTQTKQFNPPAAWAGCSPVRRAAHLFQCFYAYRAAQICAEENITDEDIARGSAVAEILKEVRAEQRIWYGDPAYGSWPAKAGEERRKMLAERGVIVGVECD